MSEDPTEGERKIFVYNIPENMVAVELKKHFKDYGIIDKIQIKQNFAFIVSLINSGLRRQNTSGRSCRRNARASDKRTHTASEHVQPN